MICASLRATQKKAKTKTYWELNEEGGGGARTPFKRLNCKLKWNVSLEDSKLRSIFVKIAKMYN